MLNKVQKQWITSECNNLIRQFNNHGYPLTEEFADFLVKQEKEIYQKSKYNRDVAKYIAAVHNRFAHADLTFRDSRDRITIAEMR